MGLFDKFISSTLPIVPRPIVGYFAQPYIAGEKLDDAVNVVRTLMSEGARATLDVLGEEVQHEEQSRHAVEIYKQALQRINQDKLDANISIKPTHMGLKLGKDLCYENIRSLVEMARSYNNFVRIDMEDSTTTSDTLDIYFRLRRDYDNVGTVLQMYLRRTVDDINKLIATKPNFRICKGIYIERRDIAYKDPYIINQNFIYVLEKLFINNCYVAIATHDEKLVWAALRLIDKYKIPTSQYEFQMLLGVDPQLRRIILRGNHKLRVYVPFGPEWHAYSTRRLTENPQIAKHVLKNLATSAIGRK